MNKIYPKENTQLYKKIIKEGGLIISEYPPKEEASSEKFLERNRIVSGIALGILVIEAKYRSGTSVTARIAKEQEKKIFAIPHEIEDRSGIGTNRLIKEGIAQLVTNSEDILNELEKIEKYRKTKNKEKEKLKSIRKIPNKNKEKDIIPNYQNEQNIHKHKKIKLSKKQCKNRYIQESSITKTIKNKEYKKIYKIILKKETSLDEIYKQSTKNIGEINEILLMLEIEGYIRKTAGGYKCI